MNAFLCQATNMAGSKHHSFHISVCISSSSPRVEGTCDIKKWKKKKENVSGRGMIISEKGFFFQNAVVWAKAEKGKLLLFEKFSCIWLKQSEIWIYDPDCLWLCVAMLTRYDLFAFSFFFDMGNDHNVSFFCLTLQALLASDRDGVWPCIHNLVPLGVIIRIMFLMPERKPFSRNENNYFSNILVYKRMFPKS